MIVDEFFKELYASNTGGWFKNEQNAIRRERGNGTPDEFCPLTYLMWMKRQRFYRKDRFFSAGRALHLEETDILDLVGSADRSSSKYRAEMEKLLEGTPQCSP
ncbi:MAG: hypothetical protein ACRDF4_08835 [Rhabdochlamydiaceae bacterium]